MCGYSYSWGDHLSVFPVMQSQLWQIFGVIDFKIAQSFPKFCRKMWGLGIFLRRATRIPTFLAFMGVILKTIKITVNPVSCMNPGIAIAEDSVLQKSE